MLIKVRRVYELDDTGDASTILVDRLWPRGLRKDELKIDLWIKDIAPSDKPRIWFGHDPKKWQVFKRRYKEEILSDNKKMQLLKQIKEIENENGTAVLVYSAKDTKNNNAVALAEILQEIQRSRPSHAYHHIISRPIIM